MSDTYTDTSVQGAERKLSDLAGQITGRANDSDMQQIKAKEKDLETKIADMPSAIDKAVSKDYPDRPAPPKPPKMEEFQAPQPRGAFDSFGNFATALGALGGLLTRHPLTASLNAATASMKALKENDVAAATQQWEQYKQQQAYAFKMADYEVARYGAYLNDKHAMTEEILSGMKMEASLLQNQNMRHATETGDISIAAGLYDRMAQLNIQAQQAADKVDPIMKVLRSEVEAANKSGKPMTGDQIAGRLAELNRMADPKLQEVIRSHEAMEKIRGQVNQKKQQDAADNIEVARGQIAELEKMAADPDATVTGLGGRASRIGETVKGWVSSGPTPASDFQSKLETLQLTLPKLLTGASKSSADERARVDTIARGLSPGDTAEKTVNALKQLDAILAERETRIKGGGEDFGGGLEGLSDEEIREQLNKAFSGGQ